MNDKDVLDGMTSEKVRVAHVFQKEFDGKISHWIVEREGSEYSSRLTGEKPDGELFKKIGRYDNWNECFWATFHETTDGSWNGASGIGKTIVQHMQVKAKLQNAAVDLAFFRSAINLRANNEGNFDRVAVIRQGPINVYPAGYEPLNVAGFVGDIDSVLALDANIENSVARNTGTYRQLPEKAAGNPLTATGELLRTQAATVLTNSAVTRFYADLDRLYSELYRRSTIGGVPKNSQNKAVREFIKRCEDRGVTADELRQVRDVRAYRNIGNGSLVMRQQNLASLGSLSSLFPPKGQENWIRDSVSALTNVETANRYFPSDPTRTVTLDHQVAQLENHSLTQGSPVVFNPEENHVIHAQQHLRVATEGLQSVQHRANPEQVLAALNGIMPHAELHIKALEGNPARQNEAKLLRRQWDQISQQAEQLQKMADAMRKQQAKQAEAAQKAKSIQDKSDPETAMRWAELQDQMKRKQERQAFDMQLDAQRHAQALTIADTKNASDISTNTAKTIATIQEQRAKAAQSLNPDEKTAKTTGTK